jgi:hypothetical protein
MKYSDEVGEFLQELSFSVDLLESTALLILGTTLVCCKYDTPDCIRTDKPVRVPGPIAKLLLQGLKGSLP